MNGICLLAPGQGFGIESYLDVDTAIAEAIQFAWEKADRRSTITIGDEFGKVEAVVMTDAQLAALVFRADGSSSTYPRWTLDA